MKTMLLACLLVGCGVQARTVAEWPLGCDEKGCPDGRCAVSSANDLVVGDVTHVGKLGDGRPALMAAGGEDASDYAFSDTVGRYVTPTNDFTVEGCRSPALYFGRGHCGFVWSCQGQAVDQGAQEADEDHQSLRRHGVSTVATVF